MTDQTPSWPNDLPVSPLLDGFIETLPETLIRTKMETGPTKVRPRTSAGTREFQMSFMFDKVQTARFDSFYRSTIGGGARAFYFVHPRTGETLDLRLTKPPRYHSANAKFFKVILEAEALPGENE